MRLILTLSKTTLAVGGIFVVGCASSRDIIDDNLAGPHPALVGEDITPPPVAPSALAITPTLYGPTETPQVDPEPILPKMDAQWKERKMPAGYEQYANPTTRASERSAVPASEVDK